ncbi:MAG: TonB-dependent receptor [Ignavibacteriaceae bacterium]|jgi:outer membrane receptor protein involved in Fe transport|nr:TonB-dependent receptor [Ignavibacteriaceae bacterium]MCU0405571.1 TonB-dependent receptor [Ignavibacteriaceae bacterium]
MKKISTNLLALLVILLSSAAIFAQTGVGKMSGKVIDADTREPLIGANIILLNTNLGAATDIDGNYFILNITPGTYEVKISYVGYAPKTIQEVRIVANITYELDVELSTDFTLPDIVVVDKKFFEAKSTNTVKVIDSDQISRLPVRGVQNLASLQSGVVIQEGSGGQEGNATINVRGGRGSEVLYIVDGVPQNNLYNRGTVAQVSNTAIDQISFQVGGYEAKYGQAQSGIVNVTTKTGQPYYNLFIDVLSSDVLNTDPSGSNLYSGSLSGPIIPGIPEHTIFLSGERGWYNDADPPAVPIEFYSLADGTILDEPIVYKTIPNNPAGVWRFSGKINSRFGGWNVQLSALLNDRIAKNGTDGTAQRQYKNASQFIEETQETNYSYSARVSQTVSSSTFWNLNFGYRQFEYQRYNPFLKGAENQLLYGDSLWWANESGMNVTLLGDGRQTRSLDANGVYRPYGWSRGLFQQREDVRIGADFDLTSQLDNHLLEFGFGVEQHTVRGYGNFAYTVAAVDPSQPDYIRFAQNQPFVFGYDVTGTTKTSSDDPSSLDWFADPSIQSDPSMAEFLKPRKPILGYLYLQDRFELQDIVLNLGIRMDYFDIKSHELINPNSEQGYPLPYAGGLDANKFDIEDFKIKDVEVKFSPRIGIGFPVTDATVFHAMYGTFFQTPELNDMYAGPFDYNQYITMSPQSSFNGGLLSEETTQYEVGFRQLLGPNSALNITAFYKNTKSLVNVEVSQYQRSEGGEVVNAIGSQNADFGTIKGFAFSFDVTRLSYFSASLQYTLSFADGTGSSTNSSQTAVFRNLDNLPPKVIAPLAFDQRHTAIAIIDFFVPEGELGFFELFNANAILSYSSGRPYTPVDQWDILGDNGLVADNTGYINSAYAPGSFRIDLKVEKGFPIGNFYLTPYVWIENLLDSDNITGVWRSTGSPYTTGYLNDPDAQGTIQQQGEGYVKDYETLEKSPGNFGIPRLIKLGLKLNFDRITF